MTMSQWFHYQRLIAHYEEEESRSHMVAAVSFAMMGLMFLLMIFIACMKIALWWILFIPAFAFLCIAVAATVDAAEAREMIEYIKWRM